MSWVFALRELGFDVWFVKQLAGGTAEQVAYFDDVIAHFGIADHAMLLPPESQPEELLDVASSAALVNISGHLSGPLLDAFGTRIYVDIDPGFTQIWHEMGLLGDALARHDQHVTIGENIGTVACPLPTGGFQWRPVRPPVVLDQWPLATAPAADPLRFTTVANWRG